MDLVKALNSQYMKEELPEVKVGDTVRVHVRIKEGSRERIQVFEGTVIAKKHGGITETITEQCFDDLDAPPVVVGAKNWITPPFEFDEFFFPQASWILDAVHEKLLPLEGYTAESDSCDEEELLRRAKLGV